MTLFPTDVAALWFSGGKDSMATLYLCEKHLHKINVLFANTGKYYPEHLETVAKAKALCPLWHEVKTDREGQWKANGLPSDLVPVDYTLQGQAISGRKAYGVQSYLQCCWENISGPLWKKTKELGANVVIRGQRKDEPRKGASENGTVFDGIRFEHPLETWTRDDVLAFLRQRMGSLPEHYGLEHSSMDCYDCTAFADHSIDRVQFMARKHPLLKKDYDRKLWMLLNAISVPLRQYEKLYASA